MVLEHIVRLCGMETQIPIRGPCFPYVYTYIQRQIYVDIYNKYSAIYRLGEVTMKYNSQKQKRDHMHYIIVIYTSGHGYWTSFRLSGDVKLHKYPNKTICTYQNTQVDVNSPLYLKTVTESLLKFFFSFLIHHLLTYEQ